jgi:hypothetical protein
MCRDASIEPPAPPRRGDRRSPRERIFEPDVVAIRTKDHEPRPGKLVRAFKRWR